MGELGQSYNFLAISYDKWNKLIFILFFVSVQTEKKKQKKQKKKKKKKNNKKTNKQFLHYFSIVHKMSFPLARPNSP